MSPRAWKQKKPTPLDRGPPLHVNRPLDVKLLKCTWNLFSHVRKNARVEKKTNWLTNKQTNYLTFLKNCIYNFYVTTFCDNDPRWPCNKPDLTMNETTLYSAAMTPGKHGPHKYPWSFARLQYPRTPLTQLPVDNTIDTLHILLHSFKYGHFVQDLIGASTELRSLTDMQPWKVSFPAVLPILFFCH